ELRRIYRTQFPVMRRYDQETLFDKGGKCLPKEVTRKHLAMTPNSNLTPEDRIWEHPQSGASYLFEYPFRVLDREGEMERLYKKYKHAWAIPEAQRMRS